MRMQAAKWLKGSFQCLAQGTARSRAKHAERRWTNNSRWRQRCSLRCVGEGDSAARCIIFGSSDSGCKQLRRDARVVQLVFTDRDERANASDSTPMTAQAVVGVAVCLGYNASPPNRE